MACLKHLPVHYTMSKLLWSVIPLNIHIEAPVALSNMYWPCANFGPGSQEHLDSILYYSLDDLKLLAPQKWNCNMPRKFLLSCVVFQAPLHIMAELLQGFPSINTDSKMMLRTQQLLLHLSTCLHCLVTD